MSNNHSRCAVRSIFLGFLAVFALSVGFSSTSQSYALRETAVPGNVVSNDFTWNRAVANNPNFAVFNNLTMTNFTYFPANEIDGILMGMFPGDKDIAAKFDQFVTANGFNANAQAFPASVLFTFIKLKAANGN